MHTTIFERFVQADNSDKRHFQGAGLGLCITKAYIEMLGGEIWLESEEGKGSIFYFTIPYNVVEVENTNIKKVVYPAKSEEAFKNLKILIVEDDKVSKMLLTLSIEKFSKEIIKVTTGSEAVESCRNNPDLDLILMDIQMPEMNGYEATKQIRQFNKDVVIIAQTAYALTGDREKAIAAGCNDYITKPFSQDLLIEYMIKYYKNKKMN